MAFQLTDETLRSILELAIAVPDEIFADVGILDEDYVSGWSRRPTLDSFFQRFTPSSANASIPLVCKRWSRIATPLFYRTIVLSSPAQAKALARTLKLKPAYGAHIVRLRVKGGFGASAGSIIAAATNVSDLCLGLEFGGTHANVDSMCTALQALRPGPRRLILCDTRKNGKPMKKVVDALAKSLAAWTTLKKIDIASCTLFNVMSEHCLENAPSGVEVRVVGRLHLPGLTIGRLLELDNVGIVEMRSRDFFGGGLFDHPAFKGSANFLTVESQAIQKKYGERLRLIPDFPT